jgi:SAM-dependent methyltransferase
MPPANAAANVVPTDVPMTNCRSCGHQQLEPVLSLGETPLANSLLTAGQLGAPEPSFPLDVVFCSRCALVQLTLSVPPEEMFSEYAYFSSFADTVTENARILVERMVRERRLGPANLAMEIASNDGYLLKRYIDAGVPVLGVDPARNVADVAIANGVRTRCDFFGADLASELVAEGFRADVMHANNVMAHVPDVNGVVAGIATILAGDGVAVIETPYVRELIDRLEFDTIYHEHLFYYSLSSFDALLRRNGLVAVDVEEIPIHGGSLRVFAARSGTPVAASVERLLAGEVAAGMTTIDYYRDFAARVDNLCDQLQTLLFTLRADGKRIAAYGAAAKGATLLNRIGVGAETIDYVADRNVHKQGLYMPGAHIPIVDPARLTADGDAPDYVLLLAWNFADEVMEQQQDYRRAGGQFILPVPEPVIR